MLSKLPNRYIFITSGYSHFAHNFTLFNKIIDAFLVGVRGISNN